MKKNLWMLGVAVAALTSCTQSEVVEVANSKAIDFDVFTNKNTRAVEELNGQTLTKIHIFGYETKTDTKSFDMDTPVFDNITATGTVGPNTAWLYEGATKYWELNTTYRFAAYANGLDNQATNNAEDESKLNNSIVSYNPKDNSTTPNEGERGDGDQLTFNNYVNTGTKDLIAAISGDRVVGTSYPSTKVSFSFNHMLSKLEFMFHLNAVPDGYDVYLSNFEINGIYNQGVGKCKFKLNTTTSVYEPEIWWTYEGVSTSALTNDQEVKLSTSQISGIFYLIPQDFGSATLSFTMTKKYKNSEDPIEIKYYQANLNIPEITSGKWLPGYYYRYLKEFKVAEVQLHPIEFVVVDVADWKNATTAAHELQVVEVGAASSSN